MSLVTSQSFSIHIFSASSYSGSPADFIHHVNIKHDNIKIDNVIFDFIAFYMNKS